MPSRSARRGLWGKTGRLANGVVPMAYLAWLSATCGTMRSMRSRFGFSLIAWLYLALAWLYALNTPPWQVPDEPAHYNYVRALAEHAALPVLQPGDYDQTYLEKIKREKFPPSLPIDSIRYEAHQPPSYYLL